jgi:arylsulfatase A-like enzyme
LLAGLIGIALSTPCYIAAMRRLATLLPVLAVAVGCGFQPQPTPPENPPLNVIIVMVDTLRADHMSLYGYHRNTTPFIDSFSSGGVVFDWAWSQASCTFPSVNSLLTSRYPGIFITLDQGSMGLPEGVPTIQGILQQNGYSTLAVSASPIVRATATEYNPSGGFDRGFDTFVEGCMWLHGGCLSAKVFAELDRVQEPFFLYAHYMEPHSPYDPPKNYKKQFAGDYEGFEFIRNGDPTPIGEMLYENGPVYDLEEDDIQHLVDLYDDEIRSFDNVFRRLVGRLRDQGLLDRTVVALVSDHGEEFLEHGHIKHCRGIWSTLSHVPMVLWIPGVEDGGRFDTAVENIDLVPTLLDYLGISTDGLGFEGSSLRPLIEGRKYLDQYAFSDQGRYEAVADSNFHVIFDRAESSATLFDVAADPLEQHDLFMPGHPAVGSLTTAVSQWLEAMGRPAGFLEKLAAAKAKEEELRALGYLE